MYDRNDDGYYEVRDEIVLTSWRTPRGILGTVQLLPVSEVSSRYCLHQTSCVKWRNWAINLMEKDLTLYQTRTTMDMCKNKAN